RLRPDFAALRVQELPAGLVRERQVGSPTDRERAPFGAEDHVLEAEPVAGPVDEVARVVPPFGEAVVRSVVVRQGDRLRIPRPSALMSTMSANANEPETTTTISAADVTMRPLRSRPRATASRLSRVRSQASFMRVSRNTS